MCVCVSECGWHNGCITISKCPKTHIYGKGISWQPKGSSASACLAICLTHSLRAHIVHLILMLMLFKILVSFVSVGHNSKLAGEQ